MGRSSFEFLRGNDLKKFHKQVDVEANSRGEESATAPMTRINRGTFTLAFFLEAVMKMGTRSIDLTHIALAKERRESRKP